MLQSARLHVRVALAFLAIATAPTAVSAQGSSQPQVRDDLALPADPLGGEIVHPYGRNVPEVYTGFLEAAGGKWLLVWDRILETPRLAYPLTPVPLFTSSGDALPRPTGIDPLENAAQLASAFIQENASFLGVTADELDLRTTPFAGGYLVSGHQLQGSLPLRGTGFHLRLTGELHLHSLSARVARGLAQAPDSLLTREGAEALAAAAGLTLDEEVPSVLQIAFPGGVTDPVPAWRVWGVDAEEEGVEMLVNAVTETTLSSRRTALHFDKVITGKLEGFCPHVDDMFAIPSEIHPDRQPIPEVFVTTVVTLDTGHRPQEERETDSDGITEVGFFNVNANTPYFLQFNMGKKDRFHYTADPSNVPGALRSYVQFIASSEFTQAVEQKLIIDFNASPQTEYESFHLMAHHQMLRAYREIQRTADRIQVPFDESDALRKGAALLLHQRGYGYSYEPNRRRVIMRNDEFEEVDAQNRPRKIVPTIIHHEYAHHAITVLTGSVGEVLLNEGVSDAIATFVARTSKYAHHNMSGPKPTADPHARDLRSDRTSFPIDPRRTVAGAFRKLFRETVDGVSLLDRTKPDFDEAATARFTFETVLKWLGAKRVHKGIEINALPLEFSPLLGWEVMLASDQMQLKQRPSGHTETRLALLKQAFGSRNLFPHPFIRGDSNTDSDVDIADALKTFNFLFLGDTEAPCLDAMDTDDSGDVDISDGIALLLHLFAGGEPPAAPGASCGWDVTSADGLGCISAPCTFLDP